MGQCASIGIQCERVSEFRPSTGTLVLVQLEGGTPTPQPQAKQAMYMVKAQDTWHSFHSCGFLVETVQGDGTFTAVLSGSLPHAMNQHANPGLAAPVPLSDLLNCEGVTRVAIAELQPPLNHQEVLSVMAYASKAITEFGTYHDRAKIISGRGRKVFLSTLIGDMLHSIGRMDAQRMATHPHHIYSSTCGTWVMPDLMFLDSTLTSPKTETLSEGSKRSSRHTSSSGIMMIPPSVMNAKDARRHQQAAAMGRTSGVSSGIQTPAMVSHPNQRTGSMDQSAHVSAPIGHASPRMSPRTSRTSTTADATAPNDDNAAKAHHSSSSRATPIAANSAQAHKPGTAQASSVFVTAGAAQAMVGGSSRASGGSPRTPLAGSNAVSTTTTMNTTGNSQKFSQWNSIGSDVGTVLGSKAPFTVGVSGLSATLPQPLHA